MAAIFGQFPANFRISRALVERLIQWGIPDKDRSVEGIAQGMHARKELTRKPPDRHVEVLIQWDIQGKDSSVEGITQSMNARKDMKGVPPDRHVEVLIH